MKEALTIIESGCNDEYDESSNPFLLAVELLGLVFWVLYLYIRNLHQNEGQRDAKTSNTRANNGGNKDIVCGILLLVATTYWATLAIAIVST